VHCFTFQGRFTRQNALFVATMRIIPVRCDIRVTNQKSIEKKSKKPNKIGVFWKWGTVDTRNVTRDTGKAKKV